MILKRHGWLGEFRTDAENMHTGHDDMEGPQILPQGREGGRGETDGRRKVLSHGVSKLGLFFLL